MVSRSIRGSGRGSSRSYVAKSGRYNLPKKDVNNLSSLNPAQQERYKRIVRNSNGNDYATGELEIHIDNNQDMYNQKVSIMKNLEKKEAKGTYSKAGGILAFKNLTDNAEKSYTKEYGKSGMTLADRNKLAIEIENSYRTGDYEGTY